MGDTGYSMRIFNSDGSEPEMCGNGIRCLARFVADVDGTPTGKHKVHTLAGLIVPELMQDGQVCVDMGEPILAGQASPGTQARLLTKWHISLPANPVLRWPTPVRPPPSTAAGADDAGTHRRGPGHPSEAGGGGVRVDGHGRVDGQPARPGVLAGRQRHR